MNKQPLVSIIIPTYNRAHLIGETLDSVLAQTYQNWECIVVDDGSTDNTDAVVGAYVAKDKRFQYHHRPADRPKGANACRNYGFELSKGVYIQWLDSDDLISENKLQKQTEALLNQKQAIAICKWKKFKQKPDEETTKRDYLFFKNYDKPASIFQDFGKSNSFLPAHTYLIDRTIVLSSGLWDEQLNINQDGEFFTRVILSSKKIVFINDVFAYYRIQQQESTSSFSDVAKAIQSVDSWKMIESHLAKSDIHDSLYLENAKNYLYFKLVPKFKNVIFTNEHFFAEQIKNRSLWSRIKRKLF